MKPTLQRSPIDAGPRRVAVILGSITAVAGLVAVGAIVWDGGGSDARPPAVNAQDGSTAVAEDEAAPPTPPTSAVPSAARTLALEQTITGDLASKSVVASGTGLVFAQNMMYKHTVSVFDSSGKLVKTIPDGVSLDAFGIPGHPGIVQGAPTEAAFTPGGRYAYVSNYSMYGAGYVREGHDTCSPSQGIDDSYLYRIDSKKLQIDRVIPVGKVPKAVAVTPDGRYVLTSNWCSYDVSVIDTNTNTEVTRIPLGAYPRGIAVDSSSSTAYVAMMGARDIAAIDLTTFVVSRIGNVGGAPRHVVIDPTDQFLYVTLNADGQLVKVDLQNGSVVARASTGSEPRTVVMAPDGQSLYLVNYGSNTVSKLAAADLGELQTVATPSKPIGVTYEPTTNRVWVACYSGEILVFTDA